MLAAPGAAAPTTRGVIPEVDVCLVGGGPAETSLPFTGQAQILSPLLGFMLGLLTGARGLCRRSRGIQTVSVVAPSLVAVSSCHHRLKSLGDAGISWMPYDTMRTGS